MLFLDLAILWWINLINCGLGRAPHCGSCYDRDVQRWISPDTVTPLGAFGWGIVKSGLCFLICCDGGGLVGTRLALLAEPPALGGEDCGARHQLEDDLLAEGVMVEVWLPRFLDERTFEDIRVPCRTAGRILVGDADIEIVFEARDRTGRLGRVGGQRSAPDIALKN